MVLLRIRYMHNWWKARYAIYREMKMLSTIFDLNLALIFLFVKEKILIKILLKLILTKRKDLDIILSVNFSI